MSRVSPWVLQGWAEPDLLGTYEAERRVVAELNLTRSTDPTAAVVLS